jgi:hypothetical protein
MNKLIISGISVAVLAVLLYLFCLNHVSVNHVGVAFHTSNGNIEIQTNAGWYITSPLVKVVELDTMPMAVHIPSDAKVINTKIVRLKPEGIRDFIKLQGFSYNLSQYQYNILMGYAFSGQTNFSFMEIVQQGGLENFK